MEFEGTRALLADWPEPDFIDHLMSRLPAPRNPETGEKLWENGKKLFGKQEDVVKDRYRFKKIDGGVRVGKSETAATCLLVDIVWRISVRKMTEDLWGVVADSYSMAEEEMRHLHRMLEDLGIPHNIHTPMNSRWRITFPGMKAEVHTMTAADVTKIASRPYRGMVIAEAAQTVVETWYQCRARVSQTKGWVLMEGTFERRKGPWYGLLTQEWKRDDGAGKVYTMPSWENPIAFPGGREDPEILLAERDMPPGLFREKFAGEPQKPNALVFPEAEQRYVVRPRFPGKTQQFDPERPVILGVDPGIAHAYAVIVAQFYPSPEAVELASRNRTKPVPNVCHIIDVIYRWGKDTRQIVEECAQKPWARYVTDVVLDFAARQRRAEGPPAVQQWAIYWREIVGNHIWCHADQVPLAAGYDGHRRALMNAWPEVAAQSEFNHDGRLGQVTNPVGPRLYIAPDAAAPFFGGHVDGRLYAGEYNLHVNREGRDGEILSDTPVDRHNDAIKAVNYLLYWKFGPAAMREIFARQNTQPFVVTLG
jgi:hypothetical protein